MTIEALLAEVSRHGGRLSRRGDMLHIEAPGPLPGELMERLRAAKPELMRLLSGGSNGKVSSGDTATIRQPSAPLTASEETAIRAWLASIEEDDPDTVVNRCRRDQEARAYFLSHARRWMRQEKVRKWLGANPGLRLAVVVEEDGDRFIATVGVRGSGIVDYYIDRRRYDGIKLLELVERYGCKWPKVEAAA